MNCWKQVKNLTVSTLVGWSLFCAAGVFADEGYPSDYKPSKPADNGKTNVLARVAAISTYMTDKLNGAGGQNSPMCYRNCVTISFNDVLKCTESKVTYDGSESCERDAAQKIAACDPKCQ